jgi:hypothetical protein
MIALAKHAMTNLRIIGLEGQAHNIVVQAQFNPTEILVSHALEWQQQPKKGPADLEFVDAGTRMMQFELLFDGFEAATSVQPHIAKLQQLSDVDSGLKRPPKVAVVLGSEGTSGVMPRFEGVIDALSVRYVTFNENGMVLRASASLRFKEAKDLKVGKPS